MEKLTTGKINAKIAGIAKSRKAMMANVQTVILQGMLYAHDDRDTGILSRLFQAMPSQFSDDVVAFIEGFTPLNFNKEKSTFKIGKVRQWNIEAAATVMWNEYNKPEKTKLVDWDKLGGELDALKSYVKKIEKACEAVDGDETLTTEKGNRDNAMRRFKVMAQRIAELEKPTVEPNKEAA